jgi:hypothetical protein
LAEEPLKLDERFPIPSDVRAILERAAKAERPPSFYERYCKCAARALGGATEKMKLTEGTLKTLKQAKLRVSPGEWWSGFLLLLLLPTLPCVFGWLVLGLFGADMFALIYLPLLGIVLAGLLAAVFQTYPSSVAAARKSEAQSQAVNTVMLLSFALYHRPDLRGAAIYAADAGKGKLAEDLQRGLFDLDEHKRYETVRHFLTVLAHEWGEIDEGTRQAIFDILRSSGTREEAARLADIAKAPERVFESTERQLGTRLNALVMPTMAFLVVKIRKGKQVINQSVYLVLGVTLEGHKELLGLWLSDTEGAKFWLGVLTDLQNRGVQDVLIACVDGLSGFPEAIFYKNSKTMNFMPRNFTRFIKLIFVQVTFRTKTGISAKRIDCAKQFIKNCKFSFSPIRGIIFI